MDGAPYSVSYKDVLVYIYTNHRRYVRQRPACSLDSLAAIVADPGKGWDEKTNATVSKAFSGTSSGGWLTERLEDGAIRERLETALGLPGVLEGRSTETAKTMIERRQSIAAVGDKTAFGQTFADVRIVTADNPQPLGLKGPERRARNLLARSVVHEDLPIVHWSAEPWSGASIPAITLIKHNEVARVFDTLIMIRSGNGGGAFDSGLRAAAEHLGVVSTPDRFPEALAMAMRDKRVLLVICDACHIPGKAYAQSTAIRRFLTAIIDQHQPGDTARVVTIGRSREVEEILRATGKGEIIMNISYDLNQGINIPASDAKDLFRKHFDYYRRLRGDKHDEVGGSRLKRSLWHYQTIKGRAIWLANVRLRAYFASNFDNFAYFDPTAGFQKLAGSGIEPPMDIQLIFDDISGYLKREAQGKQKTEIRALRLCSTAKHWVSPEGLDYLRTARGPEGQTTTDIKQAELTLAAFDKRAEDHHCPIVKFKRRADEDAGLEPAYATGLGIRAIVQDQWRHDDPSNRALVHWRVAYRMWSERNNHDLLAHEFPYLRHYGRSKIYFLGNTVTHLIRAIEAVNAPTDKGGAPAMPDGFPGPPTSDLAGCDPAQVLTFCFSRIFQSEMNGNKSMNVRFGGWQRAMSKRHGAFEYSAELLQLMSKDGVIGQPHPALPANLHAEFKRECGFALLDLGDLDGAKRCFDSILEQDDLTDAVEIDVRLCLALVHSEKMQLERAETEIARAESCLERIKEAGDLSHSAFERRVLSRQANVLYLKGEYPAALKAIHRIEQKEDGALRDPDLLHLKVALISLVEQDHMQALQLAASAAFRSATDGYQHEAIGFRIAAAHAYRKTGRPDLGESTLDDVLADIMKYGCSERTLMSLCLEAGRVIIERDDLIRAYASYLRPCALRAHERGFERYAGSAAVRALNVLKDIQDRQAKLSAKAWKTKIDDAIKAEKNHVKQDRPASQSFYEVDPLYGYFLDGSNEVIKRLGTAKGIKSEIRHLESIVNAKSEPAFV